jgi:hypothetical protein
MLLSQLPRGVALWRVGQTSYLVEHDLSDEEKALADTDTAMRAEPRQPGATPGVSGTSTAPTNESPVTGGYVPRHSWPRPRADRPAAEPFA